jgi:hypothetical protein
MSASATVTFCAMTPSSTPATSACSDSSGISDQVTSAWEDKLVPAGRVNEQREEGEKRNGEEDRSAIEGT